MRAFHKKDQTVYEDYLPAERGFAPATAKPVSMILIYPNSYHIAMSSLGFQSIYYHANSAPELYCDRGFYLPGLPSAGIMSKKPLRSFDIVAFSVSYEPDYFNIIDILRASGMNPLRLERPQSDPLVIIGGIAPTINPAPLANIADAIVIGDGEEAIAEIAGRFMRVYSLKNKSGTDIVSELSFVEGVFCPALHSGEKISRRLIADLDKYPSESFVLTPYTEFPDRFLIETGRGCGRRCRYCAADYIYPYPRIRSKDHILEQIDKYSSLTSGVGLLGVAVADHPAIEEIVLTLHKRKMDVSISSLRVESITQNTAKMIIQCGQRSITLAPETGSDELRFALNKRFTNDTLVEKINIFRNLGLKELKLYFIFGLPGETETDIKAIVRLTKTIAKSGLKLKLNLNPFIPKPHTPFQTEPMNDMKTLKSKMEYLKKELACINGLKLNFASLRESYMEAQLCRADAQTGSEILLAEAKKPPKTIPALNEGAFAWDIVQIKKEIKGYNE